LLAVDSSSGVRDSFQDEIRAATDSSPRELSNQEEAAFSNEIESGGGHTAQKRTTTTFSGMNGLEDGEIPE
jgi:hypothetical protein